MDAKWDTLDMIAGLSTNPLLAPLYKYGTMITGVSNIANVANTGISTRKIYTNSGYLELDLKFRVVDWKGQGDPIYSAFALASMCLPKNLKNYTAKQAATAVADITIGAISNGIALIPKGNDLANSGATDLKNLSSWAVGAISMPLEGIQKIIPQLAAVGNVFSDPQFLVMASAPSTITVQIGNYFKHNDMIVNSVKCDFSKQATSTGPLYADFDMSISSRQAILLGTTGVTTDQDLGLMVKGQRRVSYQAPTSSALNAAPQSEILSA
jgi:hypothetical protein